MSERKIRFSLTQTETTGNIQNRLFIELVREKHFFDDKNEFYINLKIIRDAAIVREKFSIEEIKKATEALDYVSENESTFPTKGSPEIKFSLGKSLRLTIKYTNGWNFMLKVAGIVFRIQYNELRALNELLKKTIEILNVQKQ